MAPLQLPSLADIDIAATGNDEITIGDKQLDDSALFTSSDDEIDIELADTDVVDTANDEVVIGDNQLDDAALIASSDEIFAEHWGVYDGPYSDVEVIGDLDAFGPLEDAFDFITNGTTKNDSAKNFSFANEISSQSRKRVITAIDRIHHWLNKLKAELTSSTEPSPKGKRKLTTSELPPAKRPKCSKKVNSEAPSPKGNRNRTTSDLPPVKRPKGSEKVNITAERVYLRCVGIDEVREFVWQRSIQGVGQCWVSHQDEERDEVVWERLLLIKSRIAIDIRVNNTWLPIKVEWDETDLVYKGNKDENDGGGILTVTED